MGTVRRTFSLDDAEDLDLLTWLDGLEAGQRSQTVRAALRARG